MMSRVVRLTLAIAWLLFTSIIVPAHTRGYITWGKGDSCCKPKERSCCASGVRDDDEADEAPLPFSKQSKEQQKESREHCAVCFTVALFDIPPAFVIYSDYLSDVERVRLHWPDTPVVRFIPLTYQSRAPPAC